MKPVLRFLLLILLCATALKAAQAVDIRKLSTEPRRSAGIGGSLAPDRMDFDFGSIRAWLLADGNLHVEGTVQHRGALCAEYRVGLQFGIGSPGCANVEWIGQPVYVTYERQCNNALLRHIGGDVDPVAAREFDNITCAQRLIDCSGNCK